LADPPCMLVLFEVPVLAAPLPAVLLAAGLPVPLFVPPLLPLVPPVVAGVDVDVLGSEVIGVGGSGSGLERTLATNVLTSASL